MLVMTPRERALFVGFALVAVVLGGSSSPAALAAGASELVGQSVGTTVIEIATNLHERGYEVLEIEREHGMLEVDAVKDGIEFEIEIDLVTGIVDKVELDD